MVVYALAGLGVDGGVVEGQVAECCGGGMRGQIVLVWGWGVVVSAGVIRASASPQLRL